MFSAAARLSPEAIAPRQTTVSFDQAPTQTSATAAPAATALLIPAEAAADATTGLGGGGEAAAGVGAGAAPSDSAEKSRTCSVSADTMEWADSPEPATPGPKSMR